MKQFSMLIFSVSLFLINVFGQFSLNLDVSALYDDNLFRSPYIYEDILIDIDTRFSYRFLDNKLNIYYNPEFIQYRDYSDRNFSLHSAGVEYYKEFGSDQQNSLYTGGNYLMRINGDIYDFYNYNQLYIYTGIRLDLDAFFLKTGYNFRYRYYLDSDYSSLTNQRHSLFVQLNKSFPSRTSLILEGKIGNKSFNGIRIYTTYHDGSNSPDDDGGRRGRGYGDDNVLGVSDITNISSTTATDVITLEPPDLTQFVMIARIAQSVMPKMGIYFQYRWQTSLTSQVNYYNSDAYFQDEELFDDPFSYESNDISSQLTWMLPGLFKLKLGGAVAAKNYISEQAYVSEMDSTGMGGLRSDDLQSIHCSISKILRIKKVWLYSIILELSYSYQKNKSNSFWYNYKNSFYSFGIKWNI